jgi:hypothetical protein
VIDLVSKLDEEFSALFSGKIHSNHALIMTHGAVYVHDQLVPANSPLGVRTFLG